MRHAVWGVSLLLLAGSHAHSGPVLPTAIEFHFRPLAAQWNRTGAVVLVPPRQLKPKIPDIRIFIQSLTV